MTGWKAAITGGGGELCGFMAESLAERGAHVAILDINEEAASSRAEKIRSQGGVALSIAADVTSRESVEHAAGIIKKEFSGLHLLINGAGGNHPGATTSDEVSFFDLPAEAVHKVFNLNCLGTIIPSQVLGRLILETVQESEDCRANIINLSSMNAFRPLSRIPAYSAAKAAVSNFTQWLAVHMAQNYTPRIRVNAIAPGFFLTNQNYFLLIDKESGGHTDRGQTILDHSPAGRLGKAEDLLSTLLWLLDPKSSFITGTVVPVDGGFNAWSGV
ncbi:MAG: SDR family oxidoreductase [bacterium]